MADFLVPGQFDDADEFQVPYTAGLSVEGNEYKTTDKNEWEKADNEEEEYEDDSEDSDDQDDWNWDEQTSDFTKKYNAARFVLRAIPIKCISPL